MEDIKYIIESLIFISETPLTIDKLKSVFSEIEPEKIRDALDELSSDYENRKGGFYLYKVAGGYQFRTKPEYSEWISRLMKPSPSRLSKAAMETLAIVAYKQPIIRSDVEHIRGVDSGGILRMLLERKLIRVLGRKEIPGRPLIYATSKTFLEVFGLNKLNELPTPQEIESAKSPAIENTEQNLQTAAEDADDKKQEIS